MKILKSKIIKITNGKNLTVISPVNIYEAEFGKDCFVGYGVIIINDKFENNEPARGNKTKWKRTQINSNVYIGSNSTILPVKICSNIVIGAGSVVSKNITKPGKYIGNPAKKLK